MNMNIKNWGKHKVIVAVVLALLVLIGLVTFLRRDTGPQFFGEDKTIQNPEPESGELAIVGTLKCLPYTASTDTESQDCVMGLLGDDGKTYALNAPAMLDGAVGDKVRVVGKYSPNAHNEESNFFLYDGVIDVRVFKKI